MVYFIMSKSIKFLVVSHLFMLFFVVSTANACQIGCMKAEIAGITDLANSLNKWADMLPGINENFHQEIRADLRQMDVIAVNLIELLNRRYGEQIDATSSEVKVLINHAVSGQNHT